MGFAADSEMHFFTCGEFFVHARRHLVDRRLNMHLVPIWWSSTEIWLDYSHINLFSYSVDALTSIKLIYMVHIWCYNMYIETDIRVSENANTLPNWLPKCWKAVNRPCEVSRDVSSPNLKYFFNWFMMRIYTRYVMKSGWFFYSCLPKNNSALLHSFIINGYIQCLSLIKFTRYHPGKWPKK